MYEWPAQHSAFMWNSISMILGRPDDGEFEEIDLAK
jgi:hypothetical protein